MATNPCNTCSSFDNVLRGTNNSGHKETNWGWCAKKSVYPALEEAGQKFPAGVRRKESPGERAEPFIVKKGQVVASCTEYQPRKSGVVSKADLMKKLREQNGNKIAG